MHPVTYIMIEVPQTCLADIINFMDWDCLYSWDFSRFLFFWFIIWFINAEREDNELIKMFIKILMFSSESFSAITMCSKWVSCWVWLLRLCMDWCDLFVEVVWAVCRMFSVKKKKRKWRNLKFYLHLIFS